MGVVERYPAGTFCWIDLGTADLVGATRFYGDLLGWEFVAGSSGDERYTIARLRGLAVAGIRDRMPDHLAGWDSYVAVDDIDTAAALARERHAEIGSGPGFVVVSDPGGGEVTLRQVDGHGHPIAQLVNEVGTWHWSELVVPDLAEAASFYADLLGWSSETVPGPIERMSFTLDGLLIGGAHAPGPGERPDPRWDVSFRVADVDAAARSVADLGGSILLPPMDIPIGRFTIAGDPEGNAFTLSSFARPFRGVDGS